MKTFAITYVCDDGAVRHMTFDAETERGARLLAWNATVNMDGKITKVVEVKSELDSIVNDPVAMDAIRTLREHGYTAMDVAAAYGSAS